MRKNISVSMINLENLILCSWLKPPGDSHSLEPRFLFSFNLMSSPHLPVFVLSSPLESPLLQPSLCPVILPSYSSLEPSPRQESCIAFWGWRDACPWCPRMEFTAHEKAVVRDPQVLSWQGPCAPLQLHLAFSAGLTLLQCQGLPVPLPATLLPFGHCL